ncbi:phospholipase D-like domain-containing protein [Rhizobium herbae]|uniref:Phospholipase D n=1 Tax=Rhizobium herbae TaxID=508661 RepID=A0ABS4EUE4_9HYPH|nr:phospholipase D-like domain-containing protein [Rhizobium herbae]MBP1861569.1 phosphatidylserine/phosphatidylglycerophosphate/cardiolipin synthase-like enzyme [Rhizobium herbae]
MRNSLSKNGLTVLAVAGTYVVLLGFDLKKRDCAGLLGFSIHRTDPEGRDARFLEGMKTFTETDPGFPPGSTYSSEKQPFQSFQWADYSAEPGKTYIYTVTALKGTPSTLVPFKAVSVKVTTESPQSGNHDIYFNRGVAASQEYVRRFGDRLPKDVQNGQAFIWLSRGLYEAMKSFVEDCVPGKHQLRISAYELNYEPFLMVLRQAASRGIDIKIIFDARKAQPQKANREAIAAVDAERPDLTVKLTDICIERKANPSYISHNKFMVKIENGQASSVWTGGANFSDGGIFGHSNVAHVVEEPAIADLYLKYWTAMATDDPGVRELVPIVEQLTPLPSSPRQSGTGAIFSPRKTLAALSWYAGLGKAANEGLFMTFAFGINDLFKDVYRTAKAPFRLALLEAATRPMKKGSPELKAEQEAVQALRNMPENTFAIGSMIATNKIDGWVKEQLSGLNGNVDYIHNKFMLVDPLSDNPIVVAGSANFSDASTKQNDENMIVVVGNKRVADIYLGEFMRLYTHHAFRESLAWRKPNDPPKPLRTDDWWQTYFGNTAQSARRQFFARSSQV